jgi:hypothetical protein
VLPAEGLDKVQGKRKKTRLPRGLRGGRFTPTLTPIRGRSGAKRFSYVLRKVPPFSATLPILVVAMFLVGSGTK